MSLVVFQPPEDLFISTDSIYCFSCSSFYSMIFVCCCMMVYGFFASFCFIRLRNLVLPFMFISNIIDKE